MRSLGQAWPVLRWSWAPPGDGKLPVLRRSPSAVADYIAVDVELIMRRLVARASLRHPVSLARARSIFQRERDTVALLV